MSTPAPHIVIYGNPADGYRFVGAFESEAAARAYIAAEPDPRNMWVAELDGPATTPDPDMRYGGN